MIHRMSKLGICLAALPLVWGLSGCGGGGSTPKKTTTPTPPVAKDKADESKPAGAGAGSAATGGEEGWGTIKGQIVFGGDVPEPEIVVKKGDPDAKDAATCATQEIVKEELVVHKLSKGMKWVLVYIGGKPKVHPDMATAEGTAELSQKFCTFKPHMLAMRQGQKFLVTSEDGISHNTKGDPFKNIPFNPIVPPAPEGEKSEIPPMDLVAESKPIGISCNIHPWMKAWVAVFDHPYYAVTDENGNFEIKDLQAGTQNLVVWQEKIGWGEGKGKGKEITVKAGDTTDLGKITLNLAK